MTVAARNYTWPPFEPGNDAALKHGARSDRFLEPIVAALLDDLCEVAPWCTVGAFRRAAEAWARAEARCILIHRWLDEHGLLDDKGEPRPAVATLEKSERTAANARSRLGLDPSAWAALHRTMTASPDGEVNSIEALRGIGAQIIEATEVQPALPSADGDGAEMPASPSTLVAAACGGGATGEEPDEDDDDEQPVEDWREGMY